jgi:cysteine desulfurase
MLVNNELGTIEPLTAAADAIKQTGAPALLHCDAVQAFGKMTVSPQKLGVDLLTASAHKIHGPKGVGILYIKKGVHIKPLISGGGQENGLRSGTENILGITAFGAAVEDLRAQKDELANHIHALRSYAEERLTPLDLRINQPKGAALPYILNITLPNIKSEPMLHALSADKIFVSSGSACSSHSNHPSESLIAFGLTPHEEDCSLRISFSRYTTREEIDALCVSLQRNIERLVKIR